MHSLLGVRCLVCVWFIVCVVVVVSGFVVGNCAKVMVGKHEDLYGKEGPL